MDTSNVAMPTERTPIRLRGNRHDPRFWLAAAYRAMSRHGWTAEQRARFEEEYKAAEGPDEVIEIVERYFEEQ